MNKLGKTVMDIFYPKFKSDEKIKKTRKNGIIMLSVGAAVMIVAFILIGCIDNIILELILAPFVLAALIVTVFGFLRIIQVRNEMTRLKNVTCDKCKTRLRFADVQYELGDFNVQTSTNSKNNQLTRKTYQLVNHHCTCPNCGETKSFSRSILVKKETLNSYGAVMSSYDYDVEAEIVYYFREDQENNSELTKVE